MTQYYITLNEEDLHHLFSGNDESLREVIEQFVNQVLEQQRTEQINAEPYERTEQRRGMRNGYKERGLTTRVGTLTLRVPQIRNGIFTTDIFERYQRSERALIATLMEMVVNGVSTRKVARITEELCGTSFSASTVSQLCKDLDVSLRAWKERDLSKTLYPFLILDGIVIKVREDGKVRPFSLLVATGINQEGYREILGMELGNSETEESWSKFFKDLKARGLRGVDIVVSDNHGGLVNAVERHFQGSTWQRCQTHFAKNILDSCPKNMQKDLKSYLRAIFEAPDISTARHMLNLTLEVFSGKAPRAMEILEDGFDDAVAVLNLPARYRKRLRTTNGQERLNQEIRRRERVIRIFPNRESALRRVKALLMEHDEAW